jgi:hypothetical protein
MTKLIGGFLNFLSTPKNIKNNKRCREEVSPYTRKMVLSIQIVFSNRINQPFALTLSKNISTAIVP